MSVENSVLNGLAAAVCGNAQITSSVLMRMEFVMAANLIAKMDLMNIHISVYLNGCALREDGNAKMAGSALKADFCVMVSVSAQIKVMS